MNQFEILYNKAHMAGVEAVKACTPTPMIVGTPTTLFGNDIDRTKQTYYVPDGVCGFAWIMVKPGNCPFANWLKKNGMGKKSWNGGVDIWVSAYGQSMEKKMAYAGAFAKVIREAGINAYADSRMD